MTTKLAYQVSYTTEYRDGRVDSQDMHTRFFATRERAIAYAQHLTDASTESNGVFVGEWITPFAGIIAPEDLEEIRVTATIETVTLDEIEAAL